MNLFKAVRAIFAASTFIVLVAPTLAELPNVAKPTPDKATLDYGLKATKLAGGWYVIAGANDDFSQANGCNIINTGFYMDDSGVYVINTGTSRIYGEQQRTLINSVSKNKPVKQVVALNLHPDYFLGNQAYPKEALAATKLTMQGIKAEAALYETNLYRLCGDWMKGTESVFPVQTILPGNFNKLGDKTIQTLELKGHTDSDLVLFDPESKVMWAGGLVFYKRIVTTPHAQLKPWIESLKTLQAMKPKVVVPSHGPLSWGTEAIDQTLDYLSWLDKRLTDAANMGEEMNDVMKKGAPERFRNFAGYPAEFYRNVTNLYPLYEKQALGGF
ncbi:quinoprotein relay system zinc metallohydrolase 1 [Limnobacter profundi]|uniref:Quinoprotein relay system zinc metallohydrolase 1 n=1 Tax=Limnobacter profundi TaxID=2732163 RepID=A0ABX6N3K4_9BURK|nr:quinoprotein relay system zinc metallohydrolase 1 [Limnobacter sp. SAORIC-580]QJR28976.1 quinoprotein relay system zinc metallohydrolase 1 [Limnobacter sp. SAORIC-580]